MCIVVQELECRRDEVCANGSQDEEARRSQRQESEHHGRTWQGGPQADVSLQGRCLHAVHARNGRAFVNIYCLPKLYSTSYVINYITVFFYYLYFILFPPLITPLVNN